MSSRPAVFFDRDNTLIANDGYLGDPAGVALIDGAADLIAKVRSLGFATVVISNQSGVARGKFTEDDVRAVNARLDQLLHTAHSNAAIDRHEFCPFHPDGTVEKYARESELRKPAPGMIRDASLNLGLDLSKSWVVGDAPRDVAAGKAAGCKTILVKHPSLPPSPATETSSTITPDFVVASLREAGDLIERETLRAKWSYAVNATEPAAPSGAASPSGAEAPDASPPARRKRARGEGSTARLEQLAEEILDELRRREDVRSDFSVTKLLAGVVQVIALATLFMAYLRRDLPSLEATLLTALVFQTFAIALLIMEKQRL